MIARGFFAGVCVLLLFGSAVLDGELASAGKAQPSKQGAALTPGAATEAFGLDLIGAQSPGNVVLSPDSVAAAS